MLQLIKFEFDNLDNAIKEFNILSLKYNHIIDYNIITTLDNKYCLILKFDIDSNKLCQYLELASLNVRKSKKDLYYIYEHSYSINLYKNDEPRFLSLDFNKKDNGIDIYASFGFKDSGDILSINFDKFEYNFKVHTYKFKFIPGYNFWSIKPKEILIQEQVNYEYIYENIINMFLFRGYLFDIDSLDRFKNDLKCLCTWLNKKDFL